MSKYRESTPLNNGSVWNCYINDPMALIIFYNGIADTVLEWRNYKQGDTPPYQTMEEIDYGDSHTYEMIWMYCVLLFGDYGTSPRSGWIEDFDGFHEWLDGIAELEDKSLDL